MYFITLKERKGLLPADQSHCSLDSVHPYEACWCSGPICL